MRIRHIRSEQEFPWLADMLAKAYPGNYAKYYDLFQRRIAEFPGLKLRDCRVLEVDGDAVSHVRVVPHVMRVGRARLRLGGIGGVGTHPDHQKRGYAAALLHDTMQYMQREGYDISLLFGIANFYPRFGYASALAQHQCTVAAASLPKAPRGLGLRRFREADLGAVMELHRRHGMHMVGAMERDEPYWRYMQHNWPNLVLVQEGRKPIGYVQISRGSRPTLEEAALPERVDVYDRVLAECAVAARECTSREVALNLPAAHPLVEHCRGLGARLSTEYRRDGGAMGRLIRLDSWARRMCPEWTARLRASAFNDYSGALGIECELGRATLAIERGKVSAADQHVGRPVHVPQRVLAQLTLAYRSVGSACMSGEIEATSAQAKLLAALFPEQQVLVWPSDRF